MSAVNYGTTAIEKGKFVTLPQKTRQAITKDAAKKVTLSHKTRQAITKDAANTMSGIGKGT
jgi:hypothetical protein